MPRPKSDTPRKPRTKAASAPPAKVLTIAEKIAEPFCQDLRPCGAHELRVHDNGLRRYLMGTALSIAVTLSIQTAAMFYWAGTITSRVAGLEKSVDRIERRIDTMEHVNP